MQLYLRVHNAVWFPEPATAELMRSPTTHKELLPPCQLSSPKHNKVWLFMQQCYITFSYFFPIKQQKTTTPSPNHCSISSSKWSVFKSAKKLHRIQDSLTHHTGPPSASVTLPFQSVTGKKEKLHTIFSGIQSVLLATFKLVNTRKWGLKGIWSKH